ncbi:ABC transporter substrate-binding protein [Altererythrobacter sp. JGD-16]|uniref:ABC transporter substrate-binding protein n=2 Tax=Altererythrobacter lutimaris TaxID=2743979 RepID=A0A850H8K6_9SPHN|nr:ABC transporter substrate-binding protein [Altererythrobacter lutimaris]
MLALAAATALTLSCAPAPENARDTTELEGPRYISLNPCVDAMLVNVAAPHQVLAISHYSHDPASSSLEPDVASQFASTGGSVEELLVRDPDVVLASTFLSPATRQAMQELGLMFRTFSSPTSVGESQEQIRYLGELVYRSEEAAELILDIDRAIARNSPPADHRAISTVLWQPGEIVPGEQALISQLMRKAGFSSHSEALGMGQADYLPLEFLLANPPELLLIAGEARGQAHPALESLENTRVETLDPALLYCGGPTIIKAMERLAEIREEMRRGDAS